MPTPHYWRAITDSSDRWATSAILAEDGIADSALVTTDFVVVEYLNALSRYRAELKTIGLKATRAMLTGKAIQVVEASRPLLLHALDLYAKRSDKHYSLTDCISMIEMRRRRISRVLTSDRNFEQEGFAVLMRPSR